MAADNAPLTEQTGRPSEALLRLLIGHPAGLVRTRIAELLPGPDHRKLDSVIRSMMRAGYVTREGARRSMMYQITDAGRERLSAGRFRAPRGSYTHGTRAGYEKYGCKCEACRAWAVQNYQARRTAHPEMPARQVETGAEWRAANPGKVAKMRAAGHRTTRALNAELRAVADRHGQPWTAADLEMASRTDLPAAEIALALGRSLRSVTSMRQCLRDGNPRDRMLRDGPIPPTSRSGRR